MLCIRLNRYMCNEKGQNSVSGSRRLLGQNWRPQEKVPRFMSSHILCLNDLSLLPLLYWELISCIIELATLSLLRLSVHIFLLNSAILTSKKYSSF